MPELETLCQLAAASGSPISRHGRQLSLCPKGRLQRAWTRATPLLVPVIGQCHRYPHPSVHHGVGILALPLPGSPGSHFRVKRELMDSRGPKLGTAVVRTLLEQTSAGSSREHQVRMFENPSRRLSQGHLQPLARSGRLMSERSGPHCSLQAHVWKALTSGATPSPVLIISTASSCGLSASPAAPQCQWPPRQVPLPVDTSDTAALPTGRLHVPVRPVSDSTLKLACPLGKAQSGS